MTANEKIIKFAEITAETDIDAEQIATLLAILGKLDKCDVTKVVWAAIGMANALSYVESYNSQKRKKNNGNTA